MSRKSGWPSAWSARRAADEINILRHIRKKTRTACDRVAGEMGVSLPEQLGDIRYVCIYPFVAAQSIRRAETLLRNG